MYRVLTIFNVATKQSVIIVEMFMDQTAVIYSSESAQIVKEEHQELISSLSLQTILNS